ncbi:MurR/RpiR family transcriptional regulator [Rhodovibrio salinarum]|uniref:MurR/RpiR family transcriptional regulator n=1 Tax=Rhodovibrio salinarum TaxID=1087 RepID=UPI0006846B7D|nr:MurR/RpiR family transcriptional regulator [Rhodovibrio salinarum]
MPSLLSQIRDSVSQLRRSERRVADVVLTDPRAVLQMAIRQVAARAQVSEPTVMRFAQQLGYSGYRAFSYALAAEIGRQAPSMRTDISADDDVASLAHKICSSSIAALDQLRAETDWEAVDTAVEAMADARQFEFYGVGASGLVAADAQQKFFRLGRPAVAYSDPHQQVMSASVADAHTALVLFSFTGQSPEIIEAAQVARTNHAIRIGVTRVGSPLAALCDHVVPVPEMEDTFLYTPMSSRLVQLVLVDILVSALALRAGPELGERLSRIKSALGRVKSVRGDAASGIPMSPEHQPGPIQTSTGGKNS